MSSPDSSPFPVPPVSAAGEQTAPVPATAADSLDRTHGPVTVMHPAGITPYAAEGLSLDKPLFARVTYRPTP